MPGDGARFQYATQSWAAVGALPIEGPSPGMGAAGTTAVMNRLYAWQWIQGTAPVQNNLLRISEGGTNCTATITPGFYNATTIGPAIKAALEACGANTNTYTVTYNAGSGVFTIARATGLSTISLLWTDPLTTLDGTLRMTANQTGATTYNTNDARINLLQRVAGDAFTENRDPDGTGPSPARNITSYYVYAQKLWNGEIIQVDGTGVACNILPGTPTSPDPTVTLQRVNSCATPTVVSTNVFTWAGGTFGGAGGCQAGFNQRVPLFRCDASPRDHPELDHRPLPPERAAPERNGRHHGLRGIRRWHGHRPHQPRRGGRERERQHADGAVRRRLPLALWRLSRGGSGAARGLPSEPAAAAQGLWQAGQACPSPTTSRPSAPIPIPRSGRSSSWSRTATRTARRSHPSATPPPGARPWPPSASTTPRPTAPSRGRSMPMGRSTETPRARSRPT